MMLVEGDVVLEDAIKVIDNNEETKVFEENGECSYGLSVIKITSCWGLNLFKVTERNKLYSLGQYANRQGKLVEFSEKGYYATVPTQSHSVDYLIVYLGDNLVKACSQFNELKNACYSK